MKFFSKIILPGLLLILWNEAVFSQFSASHIADVQLGNIPNLSPRDKRTAYNQLNLKLKRNQLYAGLRFESFATQTQSDAYHKITQGYLQFRNRKIDIRVGSIYDLIGRGLLLRTFEIPGTIYEDGAYRVRQGFYRDLQGFRVHFRTDRFSFKVLRGKPLVSGLPPTLDNKDRRQDLIEAVEANWNLLGFTLGTHFLRNHSVTGLSESEKTDYTGFSLNAPLPFSSNLYIETAQQYSPGEKPFDLSRENPHSIYGSLNTTVSGIGVSLEYKNYNNFFLGSGFNDPPPLIKEHRWTTLNRSTHVLNLLNESGMQLELFYPFADGSVLTFNWTEAVNDLSQRSRFSEYYLELIKPLGAQNLKAFLDYAQDPFKGEKQRISGGTEIEFRIQNRSSLFFQTEYQHYQRTRFPKKDVNNIVLKSGFSSASKWTVTIIAELSTDPFETDKIHTMEVETDPRAWLGLSGSVKLHERHRLDLFWGERRGGPACASGICYEVLDFKGFEFRLSSRL